jgi:2-polyprenyl-3-methyl-5-hydroxy-6-metoxy-1,4-benzoquinol methylase
MSHTLSSYPCPVCAASSTEIRYRVGVFPIVACRSCGMVYVDPRVSNEDLFAIYRSGYFDRGGESGYADYELIAPLRIKTFARWYGLCKRYLPEGHAAALDIGCAAGYFLDLLKEEGGRHVEGIELDPRMVAALRQRSYTISDVPLELFVPSKRYQLITLFDVLEHLPEIDSDFEKLSSMLDDTGIIALVTPNYASLQRKLFGRRWFQFKPREHIYYFTPRTLTRLAEKHGLTVVHCSPAGQFADFNFLYDRLAKYNLPFLKTFFSAACTLLRLRNKIWYTDSGSMFVVLRKISPRTPRSNN